MSTPSLTLFAPREGRIIIGPNKRLRIIVEVGNGNLIFGYIVDRDRGNAIEVEIEDTDLVRILIRLVARGIAKGLITSPTRSKKIGIVYDEKECSSGCYTVNNGQPDIPLVMVATDPCTSLAWLGDGRIAHFSGETPAIATIQAVNAFITHRAA